MISQNKNINKSIFDITKSILWYQKIKTLFFCIKKIDFVIYIYKKDCDTKKRPWLSDITNSIFWYHKIDFFLYKKFWLIWWYHKIIYVISKNHICYITKSRWFLISKHLFCDITKYVEFLWWLQCSTYANSSIFPLIQILSMHINYYWELSLFQRTERQKRFLTSHNRFIYITKS